MSGARLTLATLATLPARIARPDYDPRSVRPGIVHLGIGAFHRAHQAVYTDSILHADPTWGIVGVSLRSPQTRDVLAAQDCLYSVTSEDGTGAASRIIGSVRELMVAPEDPAALVRRLADPAIRIVSMTVTEKGYSRDPATGALRADDPDIAHDLADPARPRSMIGAVVAGLAARRAAGLKPFTALACDNLPHNGRALRALVLDFAGRLDPALADWIVGEVRFPSTMVDRIVPATSDADRDRVAGLLGVGDAWPIVTEPFSQWVIEDDFADGRPDWAAAGVQFVADVAPFETMKLRLLNGAHSTLAYLGALMGHATVSAAMADGALARLVDAMMRQDMAATLPPLPGLDVTDYCGRLQARFRNPALKHRTLQIATDGSQKLPQRLLAPVRDLLRQGRPIDRLALAVAGWMCFVAGVDEAGRALPLQDPMADQLRAIAGAAGRDADRLARGLLAVEPVFGTDLAGDPRFSGTVTQMLRRLMEHGVHASLAAL